MKNSFIKMQLKKPAQRRFLRKFFGKEYFILKRKVDWFFSDTKYAKPGLPLSPCVSLKEHHSFLLRPLKNVEMKLQYNKITNLRNAIKCIDKTIIRPGEVFSFGNW